MKVVSQQSTNPLDATMTRTQVVRRKFKSSLPRSVQNRELSTMEALAKTIELFDRLRSGMHEAGLDPNDSQAGLIYYQPNTKGAEHILAKTVVLPEPGKIGPFCDTVMALDKPVFLGVLFSQHDPETEKAAQKRVLFVCPFMRSPDSDGRLIAARNQQAMGGKMAVAN